MSLFEYLTFLAKLPPNVTLEVLVRIHEDYPEKFLGPIFGPNMTKSDPILALEAFPDIETQKI